MMNLLHVRDADYKTAKFAYYRYLPSEAAAIVFSVLFGFLAIAHAYRLFRTRTWFFIPFFIGILCMSPRAVCAVHNYEG